VFRIGIGGFTHETHTFCPAPTDVSDFEEQKGVRSGKGLLDYYRGTVSCTGGYIEVLEKAGAKIVPTCDARAGVNNYVTKKAFDK